MNIRYYVVVTMLAMGGMSSAHAEELSAETVEALEAFYANFNGDEWHNNEGWLEPGTDPCEWHGIDCGSFAGEFGIQGIHLADNNLVGPLEEGTELFEHVRSRVELQRNGIHGSLEELPLELKTLDLSDNRLTGTLPPGPDSFFSSLDRLMLARNGIGGSIPESWRHLALSWLDLSSNQLEGFLEPLAFAGYSQGRISMDLADNRFEGEIPPVLMQGRFGDINLCWNDLQANDDELVAWLDEHHVGGETFESCLNRERVEVGAEVSGSWFDPERNGEGAVVHLLAGGGAIHYTFGFDNEGRQHWLLGVGTELDKHLYWRELRAERGTFGQGLADQSGGPGLPYPMMGFGRDWRMDRVDSDRFVIERIYHDFSGCPDNSVMPCLAGPISDRHEYVPLTRLAGTTCENQQPHQWISGAWFDPERDGEGFVVEVLEDGRGLVYWFTYRPDDSKHQAWMIGTGEFDGQELHVEDLLQPVGGRWGDNFDPEAVDLDNRWGSLTLEFFDEGSGHVAWDSEREGYGADEHPIERLTVPRLAECEGS